VGGKVHAVDFAGRRVDLGADALLARSKDAVRFVEEVGLASQMVSPAERHAWVWSRGALRPLPAGAVLGLPSSLQGLASSGLLSDEGLARAAKGYSHRSHVDCTVGGALRARFGDEFVERFSSPLLGGIYAGDIDSYELATAAPQLEDIAGRDIPDSFGPPLTDPVFFSFPGGLGQLTEKTAETLAGRIRLGHTVTSVGHDQRFRVDTTNGAFEADAVVVALPSRQAVTVLGGQFPSLAAELSGISYADVAMIVLSVEEASMPKLPEGSGFLVPRIEERFITACSWWSKKWAHGPVSGTTVLRCSVGGVKDERHKRMSDDQIVDAVLRDLRLMIGLTAAPSAVRVERWPAAIPQYELGHAARLERIGEHLRLTPGLFLCGAAYGGVGVAGCIAGARRTADELSKLLP